jgi:hypothetical protein
MKGMLIVLQNDVRDILHSKGFLIVAIIIGVLTVGMAVGVPIALHSWLATGPVWEEAKPLLELFMGLAISSGSGQPNCRAKRIPQQDKHHPGHQYYP